ncbi:hypothetical protein T484DRAFT_1909622, partial [Baffinella frigidus]
MSATVPNMHEFAKRLSADLFVVCMSATVPNMHDLAKWLSADLFVSSFRPVALSHFVVENGKVVSEPGGALVRKLALLGTEDPDGVAALILEAVSKRLPTLV